MSDYVQFDSKLAFRLGAIGETQASVYKIQLELIKNMRDNRHDLIGFGYAEYMCAVFKFGKPFGEFQQLLLENPLSKTGVALPHRLPIRQYLADIMGTPIDVDITTPEAFEASVDLFCEKLFAYVDAAHYCGTLFDIVRLMWSSARQDAEPVDFYIDNDAKLFDGYKSYMEYLGFHDKQTQFSKDWDEYLDRSPYTKYLERSPCTE